MNSLFPQIHGSLITQPRQKDQTLHQSRDDFMLAGICQETHVVRHCLDFDVRHLACKTTCVSPAGMNTTARRAQIKPTHVWLRRHREQSVTPHPASDRVALDPTVPKHRQNPSVNFPLPSFQSCHYCTMIYTKGAAVLITCRTQLNETFLSQQEEKARERLPRGTNDVCRQTIYQHNRTRQSSGVDIADVATKPGKTRPNHHHRPVGRP